MSQSLLSEDSMSLSSTIAVETLRVYHRQTKTPCHFISAAVATTRSLSLSNKDSMSSHLNQLITFAPMLPSVPSFWNLFNKVVVVYPLTHPDYLTLLIQENFKSQPT